MPAPLIQNHREVPQFCVSCDQWPAPWNTEYGRMCSDCHIRLLESV